VTTECWSARRFRLSSGCYAAAAMSDDGTQSAQVDAAPAEGADATQALRLAQRAFERGDYAQVRRLTAPLLDHPNPDVARPALDLLRRVQVDPAQVVALVLSLLFFGWVAWKYVLS